MTPLSWLVTCVVACLFSLAAGVWWGRRGASSSTIFPVFRYGGKSGKVEASFRLDALVHRGESSICVLSWTVYSARAEGELVFRCSSSVPREECPVVKVRQGERRCLTQEAALPDLVDYPVLGFVDAVVVVDGEQRRLRAPFTWYAPASARFFNQQADLPTEKDGFLPADYGELR